MGYMHVYTIRILFSIAICESINMHMYEELIC